MTAGAADAVRSRALFVALERFEAREERPSAPGLAVVGWGEQPQVTPAQRDVGFEVEEGLDRAAPFSSLERRDVVDFQLDAADTPVLERRSPCLRDVRSDR
jgi:hypothetical protein